MLHWLQLIRWKNLVIVFFTQLLVWYCLVYSSSKIHEQHLNLHFKNFMLLSISTLLITAAGYIINDYFDIKIDVINRPEKVILEHKIPLRIAIIAHTLLNLTALVLVLPMALHCQHPQWLLMQLGCILLLWFYSTHFKRQYIIGNVVVACLTALTIVVIVIYESLMYKYIEMPAIIRYSPTEYYINPILICLGYTFFAFMLTWMREIVKDMEDYIGDAEQGCITMPIKKGLQFSARFAQVIGCITVVALLVIAVAFFQSAYWTLSVYTLLALIAPMIWWCYYVTLKNTAAHYKQASKWLKIIMVLGISSLMIYYFTINSIICPPSY